MPTLWATSFPWWVFVVRGTVVYLAVLLLLRIGGKRQVGQMGTGEFVAILLISNAVQNSMNGGDNSVTGGLILAAVIITLSFLEAYLTYKSHRWERILEGKPTLLVYQGKLIKANLEHEFLNLQELQIKLRHQGIHSLDEVDQAVLESDGQLSLIKKSDVSPPTTSKG
jgi:uncharacterized membrane protein YcaP (DUF421 family)